MFRGDDKDFDDVAVRADPLHIGRLDFLGFLRSPVTAGNEGPFQIGPQDTAAGAGDFHSLTNVSERLLNDGPYPCHCRR